MQKKNVYLKSGSGMSTKFVYLKSDSAEFATGLICHGKTILKKTMRKTILKKECGKQYLKKNAEDNT